MFGFESGMPLKQKKSIHEKEKETLDSLIGLLNLNDRSMKLISEMTSTMNLWLQQETIGENPDMSMLLVAYKHRFLTQRIH